MRTYALTLGGNLKFFDYFWKLARVTRSSCISKIIQFWHKIKPILERNESDAETGWNSFIMVHDGVRHREPQSPKCYSLI